mgnify:CR=1 FL=1
MIDHCVVDHRPYRSCETSRHQLWPDPAVLRYASLLRTDGFHVPGRPTPPALSSGLLCHGKPIPLALRDAQHRIEGRPGSTTSSDRAGSFRTSAEPFSMSAERIRALGNSLRIPAERIRRHGNPFPMSGKAIREHGNPFPTSGEAIREHGDPFPTFPRARAFLPTERRLSLRDRLSRA